MQKRTKFYQIDRLFTKDETQNFSYQTQALTIRIFYGLFNI